jgi:hypothetical protein
MVDVCQACGQPVRFVRCGIRLPAHKAAIFDMINRAGDLGISSEEITRELYGDRRPVSKYTIKAHVWQINEPLADTGYCIVSDRRNWFLRKHRGVPR